jgi:hypothetical protein
VQECKAAWYIDLGRASVAPSVLLAGRQAIVTNDDAWQRRQAPLYPQYCWIYLADYL